MRRRLTRFWHNLKRRRIFSTGAFYVVVAWAVVQAASIAFPAFGAPGWAMRALLVAAFAGFPIVLILAWMFDFTARGIQVTAPDEGKYPGNRRPRHWWLRPLIAAPILALILGGTAWLWTSRLMHSGESEFTRQMRPDELPVVAVLPLENLTGRQNLAWAGAGIATLVRDDLAQSRFIATVSAARTLRLSDGKADQQAVMERANEAGITHVVTGEILRTPKGLTVTSRLTDLRRNVELGANRQEGLQPEEALSSATSIASVVKQGLGLPGTEKVDVFSADFASRNIAAYEAFIAGMENFLRFNYPDAQRAFAVAVQKAPEFAMARYRLAHTLAALGETDAALVQVRAARRDAARLPARERAYIAAGESYFLRQSAEAERQYRALLETHPYESEARVLLVYVLIDQQHFEQALVEAETLAAQDPGDEVAWSLAGDLNLRIGRYDAADEAIAKFVAIAPDNPNAHFQLADARFFRGQFDTAAQGFEKALQLDPNFADATMRLAQIDVLRNRPQAAIDRLQRMQAAASLGPSQRVSAAFDLASLLRAQGRCPDAEQVLDRAHADIAAEKIRVALETATRVRCRLAAGDVTTALRLANASAAAFPEMTTPLFTRGLAEIEAGDAAAVQKTIAAIRARAPPANASDRTEAKAADYLRGLWQLKQGDTEGAVVSLQSAVQAQGYEFDVYAATLAKALAANGDRRAAKARAREAAARGTPGEFRPDLEPGRREAARLLEQLGG